ncbi:hypothetical protein BSKO_12485 [Bryopsis sp. KO-2023]|nr:hypothetical protein BSKO_12485 [Bryopsis sp. KO-2023]
MRLFTLLAILAAVARAAPADEDVHVWVEYKTESMVLWPNTCDTAEFKVKQKSAYRLTVEPTDVPVGCNLEDDVWMSSKLYYRGECLEYDPQGTDCQTPSKSGIENADQMCDNWGDLSKVPYTGNTNTSFFSKTGLMCFHGDNYFFSVRSECSGLVSLDIKIETRELTLDENNACALLENFFKGAAALAVVFVIFFFFLPILCVTGGIIACCCLCPGCPCYYKKNRPSQMQPVGYPIQQQQLSGANQNSYANQAPYAANQNTYTNQYANQPQPGAYANAPYGAPQGYAPTPFAHAN